LASLCFLTVRLSDHRSFFSLTFVPSCVGWSTYVSLPNTFTPPIYRWSVGVFILLARGSQLEILPPPQIPRMQSPPLSPFPYVVFFIWTVFSIFEVMIPRMIAGPFRFPWTALLLGMLSLPAPPVLRFFLVAHEQAPRQVIVCLPPFACFTIFFGHGRVVQRFGLLLSLKSATICRLFLQTGFSTLPFNFVSPCVSCTLSFV